MRTSGSQKYTTITQLEKTILCIQPLNNPYQWYVLLTYGLKYDPYLLNEYDYNNQPIVPFTPVGDQEMSEGLFDFLFQVKNDNYLPHLAFENGDVALLIFIWRIP